MRLNFFSLLGGGAGAPPLNPPLPGDKTVYIAKLTVYIVEMDYIVMSTTSWWRCLHLSFCCLHFWHRRHCDVHNSVTISSFSPYPLSTSLASTTLRCLQHSINIVFIVNLVGYIVDIDDIAMSTTSLRYCLHRQINCLHRWYRWHRDVKILW